MIMVERLWQGDRNARMEARQITLVRQQALACRRRLT